MGEAVRFPVDYDQVEKGDRIERKRLAEIVRERPGTCAFQYKVARFMDELQTRLRERGKEYTLRYCRGDVLILTDADASQRNRHRFRKHCRGIVKAHRRLCAVDASGFVGDDLKLHDRAVAIQGRTLAAMAGQRAIRPIAYQRPGRRLPKPAE